MRNKSIITFFLLYVSTCFGIQEESSCPPCLDRCPDFQCLPCPDLYQITRPTIFTNLEFLYWRVEEGALDYAYLMNKPVWGTTPSYVQGDEKRTHFRYEPGLRASVGYFNAPKYYEVWLQYTWLYDHGRRTANAPSAANTFLLSTFPTEFTQPVQKASTQVGLHYHVIDLLVDRVFNPNPHLRLRVLGGIPLTYQKHNWHIKYFDTLGNITKFLNHWRFYGGGLKAGINFDWYWGPHIYMTALFSSGLLLGSYKNLTYGKTTVIPVPADNPDVAFTNALRKDLRLAYTVQCLIGPSYQQNFCNFRFEFFAGYEFNAWFNLQEVYRSTQLNTGFGAPGVSGFVQTIQETGVLGMHGLTARLTLDF